MKRDISIFTLLGSIVLFGCLVLSATLLTMQYLSAEAQRQQARVDTFTLNHALMQTVFNAHLSQVAAQLESLVRQEELSTFDGATQGIMSIHDPLEALDAQYQTRPFDRLILATADGKECHDHSEAFFRSDCQQLIAQFDNPLYRWHLYQTATTPRQVGMITREPLVNNQTGQVMGYLYAGSVLTDNFSLINQVNAALINAPVAVALAIDDQILASNRRLEPPHVALIEAALAQPERVIAADELYARAARLWLDHEGGRLRLINLITGDDNRQIQRQIINQTLLAVAVGTLLAITLSLIAVKLTLQPLVRLLQFTRRTENDPAPPEQGLVLEINQISAYLAQHVTELNQSRQQLKQFGDELQVTHAEVQQSNRDLERANQRLESLAAHNKTLLHQLFHLQEEERTHLAQELHDELGQTLAAVSTEAFMIKSQLDSDSPACRSVDSIYQRAQEMYDVVYNRIVSLRPLPLNDLGLTAAIAHMPVLQQLRDAGCHVELDLANLPRLTGDMEISLFRIAQEAITNTLKHAEASELTLTLQLQDGYLRLQIQDNGCGFVMTDISEVSTFGISGMRERCNAIGGDLQVMSDHGTTINVLVPISADSIK